LHFVLSISIISYMNALILLFYRIVTFFTRVPKKTRVKHMDLYAKTPIETINPENGLIYSQYGLSELPFGKGNMQDNGCGPIALYNALVVLLKKENLKPPQFMMSSVIEFLEKNGLALAGKFGTSPFAINKYLRQCGFKSRIITSEIPQKINDFADDYDTFVSIICNSDYSLSLGLHFICVVKEPDGTFTAYNPLTHGSTLLSTLNNCSKYKIRHLCTIGVKND